MVALIAAFLSRFSSAQQAAVSTFNASDAASLLAAASAANNLPADQPVLIYLSPGAYQLTQTITFSNPDITMQGSSSGAEDTVTLACADGLGTAILFQPSAEAAGVVAGGSRFSASGMTLTNCRNTSLRVNFPSAALALLSSTQVGRHGATGSLLCCHLSQSVVVCPFMSKLPCLTCLPRPQPPPSSMQLTGMAFTNNTGLQAGGLLTLGGNTSFTVTITSCSFDSNTAVPPGTGVQYASLQYAAGAALISLSGLSSNVSVTDSSFTGNAGPATLSAAENAFIANVSISSALAVACLGVGSATCGFTSSGSRFTGNKGPAAALLLVATADADVNNTSSLPPTFNASLSGTLFTSNLAVLGGGAIGSINLTSVSVAVSQFVNNSAGVLDEALVSECRPVVWCAVCTVCPGNNEAGRQPEPVVSDSPTCGSRFLYYFTVCCMMDYWNNWSTIHHHLFPHSSEYGRRWSYFVQRHSRPRDSQLLLLWQHRLFGPRRGREHAKAGLLYTRDGCAGHRHELHTQCRGRWGSSVLSQSHSVSGHSLTEQMTARTLPLH